MQFVQRMNKKKVCLGKSFIKEELLNGWSSGFVDTSCVVCVMWQRNFVQCFALLFPDSETDKPLRKGVII